MQRRKKDRPEGEDRSNVYLRVAQSTMIELRMNLQCRRINPDRMSVNEYLTQLIEEDNAIQSPIRSHRSGADQLALFYDPTLPYRV